MSDNTDDLIRRTNELLKQLSTRPTAPYWAPFPDFVDSVEEEAKCECGSDRAKLPTHSDWCPKYGS